MTRKKPKNPYPRVTCPYCGAEAAINPYSNKLCTHMYDVRNGSEGCPMEHHTLAEAEEAANNIVIVRGPTPGMTSPVPPEVAQDPRLTYEQLGTLAWMYGGEGPVTLGELCRDGREDRQRVLDDLDALRFYGYIRETDGGWEVS